MKDRAFTIVMVILAVCWLFLLFWGFYIGDDDIAREGNNMNNDGVNSADYYSYYSDETGYIEGFLEDKNGRSFADVLQEGDLSIIVSGKTADEWVTFVQHDIWYKPDNGEQYFTALETYKRGCGDCEDKAVLMAKGLKSLGLDVGLALLNGHFVVLVSKDDVDSGRISKTDKILFPLWKEYTYVDDDGREWLPIEPVYWVGAGVLKQPLNVIKTYFL